jgi:hypothetical protein
MTSAKELVSELVCGPREAGTDEAVKAREKIQGFLEQQGYQVQVQRFRFSTAGLLGFPVFGAGLGWLALLEFPLLVIAEFPAWSGIAILGSGLVALAMIALGLGMGWSSLGGDQREDANLVATRGPVVRRWIVAHLDTKAQGHSMAGRLVAVWVTIAAAVLLLALAALRLGGPLPVAAVAPVSGLAIVAGFLAGRGKLKGKSPGARDNGSGLMAALGAAELVNDPEVGILITSAEEFGLIGARYFAQEMGERLRGSEVVNFDTIDDRGPWRLVVHGRPAHALADRIATLLPDARQHRLPLGIFVDSLPLAQRGAAAITVAKLDWETFQLLHTPRDTADGLSYEAAVQAGEVIAQSATLQTRINAEQSGSVSRSTSKRI